MQNPFIAQNAHVAPATRIRDFMNHVRMFGVENTVVQIRSKWCIEFGVDDRCFTTKRDAVAAAREIVRAA